MSTNDPKDIPTVHPYDPTRSTPELRTACPNCGAGHSHRDDDYVAMRGTAMYSVCGFCHRITSDPYADLNPPRPDSRAVLALVSYENDANGPDRRRPFRGTLTAAFDRDGRFYLYDEDGVHLVHAHDGPFIDPADGVPFDELWIESWS